MATGMILAALAFAAAAIIEVKINVSLKQPHGRRCAQFLINVLSLSFGYFIDGDGIVPLLTAVQLDTCH